jgi:hypothetical protein
MPRFTLKTFYGALAIAEADAGVRSGRMGIELRPGRGSKPGGVRSLTVAARC